MGQEYLDEAFLNAIYAFLDTRTRDTDAIWTNSDNIPVLSVELEIDIVRISPPNYKKAVQVGAACIPRSWDIPQAPVVAQEIYSQEDGKKIWKPSEDVEHDEDRCVGRCSRCVNDNGVDEGGATVRETEASELQI